MKLFKGQLVYVSRLHGCVGSVQGSLSISSHQKRTGWWLRVREYTNPGVARRPTAISTRRVSSL